MEVQLCLKGSQFKLFGTGALWPLGNMLGLPFVFKLDEGAPLMLTPPLGKIHMRHKTLPSTLRSIQGIDPWCLSPKMVRLIVPKS